MAFCRACEKGFSLSAKHPRGFGEAYLIYMRGYHPVYFFFHVARCCGASFYAILEAAIPLYMNRLPIVEYLDYSLKMTGKQRDNILLLNPCILFSLLEMVAQTSMYGIVYVSGFIGFLWLAGRTHKLSKHPVGKPPEKHWGALSMGRVADHILHMSKEIISDPSLFVSEKYMMNIYSVFLDELPPFKQYRKNIFGKQKMCKSVVNNFTGLHIAHISMAIRKLFRPQSKTHLQSTPTMLDVAKVVLITMRDEMLDVKKSTYYNLSVSGNQRSLLLYALIETG